MSRDGSGNYTLPAGVNPVATGTTITSSWGNTTLEDVATAMTDSLSRSGNGGMLAQFRATDGTVSAPAMSFNSETNSGIYRAGTNDYRLAVNGVDKARITDTAGMAAFQVYNSTTSTWETLAMNDDISAGLSSVLALGNTTGSNSIYCNAGFGIRFYESGSDYGNIYGNTGELKISSNTGSSINCHAGTDKRLEINATGIDVTGTTTSDKVIISDNTSDAVQLQVTNGVGANLEVNQTADQGGTVIQENGTGSLTVKANDFYLQDSSDSTNRLSFTETQTKIYNGGGNVELETRTGNDGVDFQNNVHIKDNNYLYLCDSNDLRIYHADNGSGNTTNYINSYNRDITIGVTTPDTTKSLQFAFNGSSSFMVYQNRFETNLSSDSPQAIKLRSSVDTLELVDDARLKIGTDDDIQIYHDSASNTSHIATANGVTVTGTITAGTITANSYGNVTADSISLADDAYINVGTNNDLKIYHDGSNSYITDDGTGNLRIHGQQVRIGYKDPSSGTITEQVNVGVDGLYCYKNVEVAGEFTGSQTTVVNSTAQTATDFFGKRMVHTGGAVTYSFAAVATADQGKSVTVINSGTDSITLSITTSKFYDLTSGVDPDYAGSGSSSHTLLKGGTAEFIVTEANKVIIIGSGII